MLTEVAPSLLPAALPDGWRVREVRNECDLAPLATTWELLFRATPNASFFQTWEWFQTYWRHFGRDQQLRVLIIEDSTGTPTGIVPLTLRTESTKLVQIRRLGFPLDNWGTHYSPLGAYPGDTLATALKYLQGKRREWDVIDLRWITGEQSPSVVSAWSRAGMHYQQRLWARTAAIDLSRGWDDYWNSRTSKWRNNQRRSEKLLGNLGAVRIVHFRPQPGTTEPRWDLYDLCEQVAKDSWQGTCESGNTLNHSTVRGFLRDVHVTAVQLGCVHLSLLFAGDEPAAFTYNYVSNRATFGLRSGFDSRFQAAGPGSVLIRETIRECCARGDREFDLGESPSPYKRHLANRHLETFRFCHYSATSPLANAMRFKGWLTGAFHDTATT